MAYSKSLFVLYILIMMEHSSSEDDIEFEAAVANNSTCTETVYEVMEEAFGEVTAEVPQTRLVQFAANKYPEGGSALQLLEIPDEGSSWPFSITDVPDVVGYARGKTDVPVSLCTGM